jgi:hypothetical protein
MDKYELKPLEKEPTLGESLGSVAVYGALAAVVMPVLYVLAIPFFIVAMPIMALGTLFFGAKAIVVVGEKTIDALTKNKESES